MRPAGLAAALAGLAALLAAWVLACPPNSAPDEASHLVRGVSAATGHWVGRDASRYYGDRNLEAVYGRSFPVTSADRVEDLAPCFAFKPSVPASCGPDFRPIPGRYAYSHTGGYYPLAYVPLGLAELAARSPDAAIYSGRAVEAVLCWALLSVALVALPGRRARLGWLMALTPVTLWTAATAATNGLEICGGIAFVSGAIGVAALAAPDTGPAGPPGPTRGRGPRTAAATAFLAGGLALASSKALGPVFLAVLGVVLAVTYGPRAWIPRLGPRRVGAWLPLAAAAAGNLAWTAFAASNPTSYVRPTARSQVHTAVHLTAMVPKYLYTGFGWADTVLPHSLALVGLVGLVLFLVVNGLGGPRRSTAGLLVLLVAAAVVAAGFAVEELRNGFGLQSRYVGALVCTLPLVAIARPAVTNRHRWERWAARASWTAALLAVAANALALYVNLRRYVVGAAGRLDLLHAPDWSPPGGVALTLALIVAGAVGLALCTLTLAGSRSEVVTRGA